MKRHQFSENDFRSCLERPQAGKPKSPLHKQQFTSSQHSERLKDSQPPPSTFHPRPHFTTLTIHNTTGLDIPLIGHHFRGLSPTPTALSIYFQWFLLGPIVNFNWINSSIYQCYMDGTCFFFLFWLMLIFKVLIKAELENNIVTWLGTKIFKLEF